MEEQPKKSRRGFAAMTPERRAEIASKGGKAAHAQGKAHQFSPEEARAAGHLGGKANRLRLERERASAPPSSEA